MPAKTAHGAAGEHRRWVRLLAACNNRCRFCLDRFSLDGSVRPRDDVLAELRAGRDEGAARAVLSGGEPTLHPELPGLIRAARSMGYRWVQIISNGRRLSYAPFLRALVAAGLDEVTFSMHGSGPEIHDDLVGVPGAFHQAFAGIRGALAAGLVVSVDVVLTRRNLADAPALIRRTLAAGVREYDLLWLTPFGGAADHLERPGGMFLGPADAPALHRVLETARAGGAVVWTNRVPLAFLEGYEDLAQDPSKLEDELRGRRLLLDRLVQEGGALECRERRRCARCPFGPFCDVLHGAVGVARGERRARAVRWNPADEAQTEALGRLPRPSSAWLRTDRPAAEWRPASLRIAVSAAAVRVQAPPGVLAESLPDLPPRAALHIRPARAIRAWPRPLVRSTHDLIVPLTDRIAAGSEPSDLRRRAGRLVVAMPDADEGVAGGWPFSGDGSRRARRWLRAAASIEGFPACLAAGRPRRARPPAFDLGWLGSDGRVDPIAVLRDFLLEGHSTLSLRCGACSARRSCPGIPWRMARELGLRILKPLLRA